LEVWIDTASPLTDCVCGKMRHVDMDYPRNYSAKFTLQLSQWRISVDDTSDLLNGICLAG